MCPYIFLLILDSLFTTVGCHPTRCNEFEASGNAETYLDQLRELARANTQKVVAIGECGLDYDRLQFCDADVQKRCETEKLQELLSELQFCIRYTIILNEFISVGISISNSILAPN